MKRGDAGSGRPRRVACSQKARKKGEEETLNVPMGAIAGKLAPLVCSARWKSTRPSVAKEEEEKDMKMILGVGGKERTMPPALGCRDIDIRDVLSPRWERG